jgi:hypothetical protein
MKRTFILVVFVIGLAFPSSAGVGDVTLRLQQSSISQALTLYSSLSGVQLDVASGATNQSKTITLDINPPLPKKDAAKKIAAALREQAGVVITAVDDKHASVTRE